MSAIKFLIVAIALVASLSCAANAAGGIKGRPQQQPLSTEPLRTGIKSPSAALRPTQQLVAPQAPAPLPAPQQAIKSGPGQVAPVFNAIRVQQPIVQQQQEQVQVQQQEQEPQQQVQVQEEVDPNAAAQDSAPAVLAPARAAAAASEEEANPRPEPYNFAYNFESGDSATSGSSNREEQQDASGRVTGFYTLKGEDGRDRRVDYIADASGFRATVTTNEMGTADKDTADGKFLVQSPSALQVAASQRAASKQAQVSEEITQQQVIQ